MKKNYIPDTNRPRKTRMRLLSALTALCVALCSLTGCAPGSSAASPAEGTQTEGSLMNGSATDGSLTEGAKAESGSLKDGSGANSAQVNGSAADGSLTAGAKAKGGAQTDESVANSPLTEDSAENGPLTAGAKAKEDSAPTKAAPPFTLPYDDPDPEEAGSAWPWICSDLVEKTGSLDGLAATDDFHAFVNRDWLVSNNIPSGYVTYDSFTERQLEVDAQITKILEGSVAVSDPAVADSHRLVQDYYRMWLDWDARNALGMEPLRSILSPLGDVHTLEEMTAYLSDPATTVEALPLCSTYTAANLNDADCYAVYISPPSLVFSDPMYYEKLDVQSWKTQPRYMYAAGYMLERLGLSNAERDRILEESYSFEREMAAHMMTTSEQHAEDYLIRCNNPRTLDELSREQGSFPLIGMLEGAGVADSDVFILEQPDWLSCMDRLYDEAHLEKMKSYLIVQDVLQFMELLDRGCYDRMCLVRNILSGSSGQLDDKKAAANAVNSVLGMELGEVYSGIYVSNSSRTEVSELVGEIIDYYRTMLEDEAFLSDSTKAEAIKKLDSITVRVASEERAETDRSALNKEAPTTGAGTGISAAAGSEAPEKETRMEEPMEEPRLDFEGPQSGGSLVEARIAISEYTCRMIESHVNQPVDRTEWIAAPHDVNAYYYPLDNSINIPAGILGGVFYSDEMSREEKLARIGVIAAHEISHAFDTTGRQYDERGSLRNWWTDEDYRQFHARAQKLVDYYSGFEPIRNYPVKGSAIDTEAIADLTGVKCMLRIASEDADFDYDLFFRSYASIWRCLTSIETESYSIEQDNHPCAYLRTNAVVNQFEEFHQTYGTKPGDGMYLAPEYRLEVW